MVARPRLRRLLDATLEPGHRLTLVSAPAGFGKTTAVADWCARLVPDADGTGAASVAWMSVDEGDNHAGRLLAHVLAALAAAGLPVDPGETDADPAQVLPAVVNDAARACATDPEHAWVLVLDDYHAVTDPGTHDVVAFLLDHLPPQVHLLLTTRADPPLPLARLRSRGQLTELRVEDLRFSPDEARQFMAEVMDVDLDTAAVTALDRRTEGWAAGLQLAGLSLRDLADAAGHQHAVEQVEQRGGVGEVGRRGGDQQRPPARARDRAHVRERHHRGHLGPEAAVAHLLDVAGHSYVGRHGREYRARSASTRCADSCTRSRNAGERRASASRWS
jgi:ATP/maltotriose-dependent transcriptional regulator MalT